MKKKNKKTLINLFYFSLFFLLLLFFSLGIVFLYFVTILPDVLENENLEFSLSSQIYDKDGNVLYTIFGAENREEISLNDVSKNLVNATIVVEDERFWKHYGIDFKGIFRALRSNVLGVGKKTGGSTITQQYVKNAFLSPEKTYLRKVKEAVLALRMEYVYDKEKILESYLNIIPYGNNSFGIKKASEVYFSSDAKYLTVAQSAVLASLPQAPTRLNPYGPNRYSRLLVEFSDEDLNNRSISSENDLEPFEYINGLIGQMVDISENKKIWISGRADFIVDKMYLENLITFAERNIAFEELKTMEFNVYREEMHHPHFVFYVMEELEKIYGREFLEKGGLKIYTTLDSSLQKYVEDLAKKRIQINKNRAGANNMAILAVDAKSGEILAMLGSVNYYDDTIDGKVNVVLRPRQPGSSFKPFIYAKAFMEGLAPSSRIDDTPMKIHNNTPQNFDGGFLGPISVREALAKSRNIPAIRAYFMVGEEDLLLPFLKKFGIYSLRENFDYGYPLAIGSGELSLFEMVQGYSVFANNGDKINISGISYIEDKHSNVVYERTIEKTEAVIPPSIAFLINNILSDRNYSIGPNLFVKGQITAGKSGTSTKKTKGAGAVRPGDLWTVGYNPSFVVGVWIGNTDGAGLSYSAEAYSFASPVFSSVMGEILKDKTVEPFPVPNGIKPLMVNKNSGLLVALSTANEDKILEYFAEDFFVQTVREKFVAPVLALD